MKSLRWMVGLLCLALGSCATAPPPAEPVALGDYVAVQRQLAAYITQQLAGAQAAGLSIALVDDQRVVAAWGTGWADVAAQRAADGDTLYRVGSISKLFTDTAAMMEVARGRLMLDAPIQQALPGFRLRSAWAGAEGAAPITLRQLMTHHAGLPRDVARGMWTTAAPPPERDFRAMLRALADDEAIAPPGLFFSYSNAGLDVVGAAVEAASGQPFEARLQTALLAPLGMASASFSAAPSTHPAMARAHARGELREEPALRDVPAGGLNASVRDLARFLSLQFAGGRNAQGQVLLPPAQWAEMLRVQNDDVPLDADLRLGLGWLFSTFGEDTVKGGGPVAHHAGATLYFRSQLMMLPEQRLGVVVAANDSAATAAVNRVAQRALALMLEAKTGRRQAPPQPGFVPAAAPWSAEQRQATREACVGEYVTSLGPVTVLAEGEGLRARLRADDTTFDLLEGEQGRLGLRYRAAGLINVPLGALSRAGVRCERVQGRAVLTATIDDQRMLLGERLAPAATPPGFQAADWIGRYTMRLASDEVATVRDVSLSTGTDGRLWVEYRLHPSFGGRKVTVLAQPLDAQRVRLLGPLADVGPVARLQPGPAGQRRFVFSGWVFERAAP